MYKQSNSSRFGGRVSSFRGRSSSKSRGGRSKFSHKSIDVSRYINTRVEHTPEENLPYQSKHKFADFALDNQIQANIVAKAYKMPTHIQDVAVPEILKGSDVVGIANTGTGKTAAFLLPLVQKVTARTSEQVLIIVPTRELAQQISEELKDFTRNMRVHSVCVVGGTPIGRQINTLRYFNHFVIGTPGRLKDLMQRNALNLSKFRTVVLDEADRMLDMGFIADMRMIMSKMAAERQTLFFSATLSPDIEKLIKDFLKDPVRISVKKGDVVKNIFQDIVKIKPGSTKLDTLHDLLKDKEFEKVLVFGRTKHGVQKLSDALSKRGVSSVAIHGNKNQSQRGRALSDFKTNRSSVLVATDVAARGLDIPDVSHVINFDIPSTHEDYIHRIGRTGRSGKKGKALTFVE